MVAYLLELTLKKAIIIMKLNNLLIIKSYVTNI